MSLFRHILLGVVPVALMGCGSGMTQVKDNNVVTVAHVAARGHKLMVMRVAQDGKVRFVSHKHQGFVGVPSLDDSSIALNVAAAFTLDTATMDVCGDHVVAGKRIAGYDDVTATGHALIINNKVSILPNARLEKSIKAAVDGKGYLFQQCLIVEDGQAQVEHIPQAIRDRRAHIIYRALCIMHDGSLAIVQGDEPLFCEEFVDALVAMGAEQALYLDMGTWSWGWVRDGNGELLELEKKYDNTRYQSNWLQILF